MATKIASRVPYIITENGVSVYYTITAYPASEPGETTIFNVAKSAFEQGVPEDLSIDLSPFAYPLYVPQPSTTFPITIQDASVGLEVGLDVFDGVSTTQYLCLYGWESLSFNSVGVTTQSTVKNVTLESLQYVTANLKDIDNIIWRTDTGKIQNILNPNIGNETLSVFPVVLPGLSVDEGDSIITIEGQIGGEVQWTLEYNVVCAWEDKSVTIGFLNRFGVWETFDLIGREDKDLKVKRREFTNVSGITMSYASNGYRNITLNTGWVDDEFYKVLEEMLVSERVVIHTTEGVEYLVNSDTTINKLSSRNDQMMNYTVKFKEAKPLIPIA